MPPQAFGRQGESPGRATPVAIANALRSQSLVTHPRQLKYNAAP
jgi:hypothetical protein